ncbi:branched-chain amino acid ABC transporter permease [Amycolatopsis sp. GM8]|uniref:branched-chain amino acid ABC transporter permease n=1 Tax=Amycolatopsis sp. GM8 TaxID=2896530 RepID=UPI001F1F314B|nr:branched-chain amino acid ABC transporter permease [Amycolatopsis sp. GM8]
MSVSEARATLKDLAAGKVVPPPAYRGRQWLFLLLFAVVAWFVPEIYGRSAYHDSILNQILINAILALGFYWCFRLAGQFTFGVFAMYAAGAYVSVWGANYFGDFWLGLVSAAVVTGLLGALAKLVFARLSPIYFAIATVGLGGLMLILFREWVSFTGGYNGVGDIKIPVFFGDKLNLTHERYYLILALLVLFLALTIAVIRSPVMRELAMARDKGPVAATAGLRPRTLQLIAFAVGTAMQGVAGSLYAHNSSYFSLESFSVDISLSVLLMVLLGGLGSIYGPVIGAAIVVLLPELLRGAEKYSEVIYAALVLVIIVAFPGGIADIRRVAGRWVRRARGR